VRYEGGQYYLYDDHSANSTFVNGQQIEDAEPYQLHDGDLIGIGEHELVFRWSNIEDLPTQSVPLSPQDVMNGAATPIPDNYETQTIEEGEKPIVPSTVVNSESAPVEEQPLPPPVEPPVEEQSASQPIAPAYMPPDAPAAERNVTLADLPNVPQIALPQISTSLTALSELEGEITSLQEQFKLAQEALRHHNQELTKSAHKLRDDILHVADRMDNTIADVARNREDLAWTELLQIMEDVMSNPRDIEYVTQLARRAREFYKVFQIHQSVLNTLAECNSLLRSMISGEV
jgi:pSer/pThr/pTyr-binding forkhead associated (FHA) protein